MTDPTPNPDDERTTTRPSDSDDAAVAADPDENDDGGRGEYDRLKRYVNYAVLAGLLLFALVAVFQFYFAASSTISTWVSPDYRAPFRMVFNLVILLLAGLGVSVQLRRLGGRSES